MPLACFCSIVLITFIDAWSIRISGASLGQYGKSHIDDSCAAWKDLSAER